MSNNTTKTRKSTNQAGKGDKQRPTDKKRFDSNYSAIDWSAK